MSLRMSYSTSMPSRPAPNRRANDSANRTTPSPSMASSRGARGSPARPASSGTMASSTTDRTSSGSTAVTAMPQSAAPNTMTTSRRWRRR
jgi:hypothetical protein